MHPRTGSPTLTQTLHPVGSWNLMLWPISLSLKTENMQFRMNKLTTLCCPSWLMHTANSRATQVVLSHAAPGGDPPASCSVMLVRHWQRCTFSKGPRLWKINPPRIERTVTAARSRSRTIYFSNISRRKMNNSSQPSTHRMHRALSLYAS
jgi:hypothetical protein